MSVFALESTGSLVGVGPFHEADAPGLLLCALTDEPALRCHHQVSTSTVDRVCNEGSCAASFVARVDAATMTVTFSDGATVVAARVDPSPRDDADRALALFLFAMHLVARDVEHHTPLVDIADGAVDRSLPRHEH